MKKVTEAYLTSPSITFIVMVSSESYYVTIVKQQDQRAKWIMSGSEGLEDKINNWYEIQGRIQQKNDIEITKILKDFKFK